MFVMPVQLLLLLAVASALDGTASDGGGGCDGIASAKVGVGCCTENIHDASRSYVVPGIALFNDEVSRMDDKSFLYPIIPWSTSPTPSSPSSSPPSSSPPSSSLSSTHARDKNMNGRHLATSSPYTLPSLVVRTSHHNFLNIRGGATRTTVNRASVSRKNDRQKNNNRNEIVAATDLKDFNSSSKIQHTTKAKQSSSSYSSSTTSIRDGELDRHEKNPSSSRIRRGGGGGGGKNGNGGPSEAQRRHYTVLLVSLALFNDSIQKTMLVPIIHSLVTAPPPLGVAANVDNVSSGNPKTAIGLFFSMKDFGQLLFAPVAGALTTRTSPNAALIVSILGLGVATFIFAEASTFTQLCIARAAQGIASAAVMCGGLSLISETHPTDIRGSAIGLANSGLALGTLLGPIVGSVLFHHFGRKETFRIAAAFLLVNALAQGLLMTFAPPSRVHADTDSKKSIGKGARSSRTRKLSMKRKNSDISKNASDLDAEASTFELIMALLTNGDVLAVSASTFLIHAFLGLFKPLSQVVLESEFDLGMMNRSFVITIATFTYFLSSPLSGWLSDHMTRSKLVALGLAIMSLSSISFALRGLGLWMFNVGVGLMGVSLGISGSAGQALMADLVDRHQLGPYTMVFALSDVVDSLGLIIGGLLGGFLCDHYGDTAGIGLIGIACLLLTPSVLSIR